MVEAMILLSVFFRERGRWLGEVGEGVESGRVDKGDRGLGSSYEVSGERVSADEAVGGVGVLEPHTSGEGGEEEGGEGGVSGVGGKEAFSDGRSDVTNNSLVGSPAVHGREKVKVGRFHPRLMELFVERGLEDEPRDGAGRGGKGWIAAKGDVERSVVREVAAVDPLGGLGRGGLDGEEGERPGGEGGVDPVEAAHGAGAGGVVGGGALSDLGGGGEERVEEVGSGGAGGVGSVVGDVGGGVGEGVGHISRGEEVEVAQDDGEEEAVG
jgi:hypothetical protein